jgi:proteasome beta subunit
MGTVVAIAAEGGVAIAGDTRRVDGQSVTSTQFGAVFDFQSAGAGVVGEASDIQTFGRRLESEVTRWRLERDSEVEIDALGRIAARIARETGVEAAVAARDASGIARLRKVGIDGHIFDASEVALGSGAEIALGRLETADPDSPVNDVTATAREVIELVLERDVATGDSVDIFSLGNDPDASPVES